MPTLYVNANQDKVILEALEQQLSPLAKVYPKIPRATAFADAVMNSQPLAVYDPKHPAIAKRSVGIAVLKKIALGMEKLYPDFSQRNKKKGSKTAKMYI